MLSDGFNVHTWCTCLNCTHTIPLNIRRRSQQWRMLDDNDQRLVAQSLYSENAWYVKVCWDRGLYSIETCLLIGVAIKCLLWWAFMIYCSHDACSYCASCHELAWASILVRQWGFPAKAFCIACGQSDGYVPAQHVEQCWHMQQQIMTDDLDLISKAGNSHLGQSDRGLQLSPVMSLCVVGQG